MKSILLVISILFAFCNAATDTQNNSTDAVLGTRTCSLLCHTEVGSSFCKCPQAINLRNATLVCSSLCSMGIPSKRCRCELPSNLCFVYCSLNAEVGIATADCNCQQLLSATEKPPVLLPPTTSQNKAEETTSMEPPKAKNLCQVLCKANLGGTLCDCNKSVLRRKRDISDLNLRNMADMNYIHHDICHVLCKKGLGFDICDGCVGFNGSPKLGNSLGETRDSMCQALCSHNEGGTLCDCDGHLVRKKRDSGAFFAFQCALSCKRLSHREKMRCGCPEEIPAPNKYKSSRN